MYIKDGEAYNYEVKNPHYYAWGWIGNEVESEGWDDDKNKSDFLEKLNSIKERCSQYIGSHSCEICGCRLGSSQIKISYNGKIFSCPSEVRHYIEDHDYCPPQEVFEAVKNGIPLNDSDLRLEFDPKQSREEREKDFEIKLKRALEMGMESKRQF